MSGNKTLADDGDDGVGIVNLGQDGDDGGNVLHVPLDDLYSPHEHAGTSYASFVPDPPSPTQDAYEATLFFNEHHDDDDDQDEDEETSTSIGFKGLLVMQALKCSDSDGDDEQKVEEEEKVGNKMINKIIDAFSIWKGRWGDQRRRWWW